jgi:BlaI family penicillinase repressor
MRPAKPTLTEQELEIMKVIWKLDTATVRQVYETLLEHRRIAYTTVMTMMNILEQKGYLKKEQAERVRVPAGAAAKAGDPVDGAGVRESGI